MSTRTQSDCARLLRVFGAAQAYGPRIGMTPAERLARAESFKLIDVSTGASLRACLETHPKLNGRAGNVALR